MPMGTIGKPLCEATITTPGFSSRRGPRGPSGVMPRCVGLVGRADHFQQRLAAAAGRGAANDADAQLLANLGDHFAVGVLADQHADFGAVASGASSPSCQKA